MAEKQTPPEEDDDEAFGDFSFATSFSNPQIQPPPDLFSADDEDDDEWGDFVTPKSDSSTNHQSRIYHKSGSSAPDRVLPDRTGSKSDVALEKGVRARGALPLSIFGEEEGNDEEERASDVGFGGGELSRGKSGDLGRTVSGLGGLGISDILASLYDQGGGQIDRGNVPNQKENGLNLDRRGSNDRFKELDSHVNGFTSSFKSSEQTEVNKDELFYSFSTKNSGPDGFSSSAKSFSQPEVIRVENGRRTKSDESVFNFLTMSSGSDVFSSNLKPPNAAAERVKTDNGWNMSRYELDFNLNTLQSVKDLTSIGGNVDVNGSEFATNGFGKSSSTEDDDDYGWEFQGSTNITEEHKEDGQWEFMGTNILNGPRLDSNMSELGANILDKNSVKEDEAGDKWEFLGIADPTAKDDRNDVLDFQGNNIPTAKETSDDVRDFQGIANQTAEDENNGGWDFVGNLNTFVEEEDDSAWEFQVAPVDQNPKEWNSVMLGFGAQTFGSDTQVAGKQLESPQISDFMPKLNPDNDSPTGHDFGFDGIVSSTGDNHLFAISVSEEKLNQTEVHLTSPALNGRVDTDDSYWDFEDSFIETKSKDEVEKVGDGDQKGALPPSLFSDEPLDANDSLKHDVFIFNPSQSHSSGFKNMESSASLSDLILNLYNQNEKKSCADSPQQPVTNSSDPFQRMDDLSFSNDEDDFDGTWDFKDAVSSARADDQSSPEVHHSNLTKSKMESLVDFYSKLKDQASLAAMCHLSSLKEAKSVAEHSKEDSEVEALDEKIQDALEELNKANIVVEDISKNCTPHSCLKEFHQVLSEPKFQILESEYGLSRRVSAAEKDLGTAIELVEHAASILSILSLGSTEQQSSYISTWTEILFVCAQELQHGASIWRQAIEKNVTSQILSQTKGKKFVHALGEIFRVVQFLEASSKAYRPWILSSSMDCDSFFTLLKECSTLWSSSGLNDALKDLSDSADSECAGEIPALLESINHIHELNEQCDFLQQQDTVCNISLLMTAMIPDVKMVVWNGKQFFLPLANLWANLISSDPPMLPRLHAG
uniref:Synergin gamma C-terminal domain-containing protein n=1 Tax=Kalanchoe fedtschenkoi TaxID=63787 RepID=A0A7N0UHB5_KALFE